MTASAYLLGMVYGDERDDDGNQIGTPTRREVVVTVESASQREFFAKGEHGNKAEGRAKIFWMDYEGERQIEIFDRVFTIYRTFQRGEYTELHLEGDETL